MANLLDAIRNNSSALATQQQGQTDTTQSLAGLLRAKSGKVVAAPGVGMSNLGEQSAVSQSNQQMQNEVAPQAELQNQALSTQATGQQQAADIQKTDIAQSRQASTLQNKLQTTALLNQFQQDKGKLDLEKNTAQVQQFAQGLRLQNSQYIDKLQMEGDRARLDDANSFNEELQSTIFGDNEDVLKQQLGDRSILDADENTYRKALGQMNVDQAWTVFNNEKKAQKQRAPYEAIGAIGQAGVGAYGASQGGGGGSPAASSGASSAPQSSGGIEGYSSGATQSSGNTSVYT